MTRKKKENSTPVEVVRHKDKRKNIPTAELQDFVKDDEAKPKKVLYPRDPSLDPQLVWKGKDEQDQKSLEVPAVPVYIQEKIQPQVLIEDLRRMSQTVGAHGDAPGFQTNLFADFNGIEFEDLIEFYQHEQNWSNRLILGDSLLVMNSLAEKEGLKGKVQMIYFDPPYGIKFGSNWQVSTRKRDIKDGKAEDLTRQPEQIRAFRDTWELGIHSYLSYLRDRLVIARELLTETGSVFMQINSENSHLMACLMDEVFGSENLVANIVFLKKTLPLGARLLETMHDHILFYAKDAKTVKYRPLYKYMGDVTAHWRYCELPSGEVINIKPSEFMSSKHPEGTRYFRLFSLQAPSYSKNTDFPFGFEGEKYDPPSKGSWVVDEDKLKRVVASKRIQREGKSLSYRLYHDDFPYRKVTNLWDDVAVSYEKSYVVQTSTQVVERCILMTTDPGDLVLDPTCGSGTTAYVAEQRGRRWITIDTSRVSLALARTRIMSAKYPYYILADSPEGVVKEAEVNGKHSSLSFPLVGNPSDSFGIVKKNSGQAGVTNKGMNDKQKLEIGGFKTEGDIKKGFVYKRVPHITLKSIANNPDIKEGISREEIDAAIAKHADTEILYDQPYDDKKRIRVSGPFTVESLSPHRILSTDEERPESEKSPEKTSGHGQFETMILANLKKAGVQNTIKNERLKFDRLEPFAGLYIHGEGEYTESGQTKRAAICIGPEHGTVSPELVKEASKEAMKGSAFDLLIVCGFAFDPHAGEKKKEIEEDFQKSNLLISDEKKQYGKLTILLARMNPDLAMGDELLKKTGAGNLFMIFGEPDIVIEKISPDPSLPKRGKTVKAGQPQGTAPTGDEMITVEIKGLDIYDPTTGQIRSHSTADIACWFIDTDYNGESFFVRHAYFSGADEPYEKLKKALRAEIDESAWATLYSTKSRPFPMPSKGKIAIKVINHYGDEVLKVYEVR
jgi:adenine-specific DNA-methyltransferase